MMKFISYLSHSPLPTKGLHITQPLGCTMCVLLYCGEVPSRKVANEKHIMYRA